MASPENRARVPEELERLGGLRPGVSREVARRTGVPEADVYGVGSFYHLLAEPDVDVRVCQGLSCQMAGAERILVTAQESGLRAAGCQCLAACDQPVAVLRGRRVLPSVTEAEILAAGGDFTALHSAHAPGDVWTGTVGPADADPEQLAYGFHAESLRRDGLISG